MSSSSFSPSVLTLPATSQQLELNIVTNPTAATSPTDKWTVSGMSVTRDATGSPLDPLVPTGFNMSSTANGQTFTTVALTVPSTLMNKKLKVEFYYTYVSGTSFTLDVLDGADVHYNLTTDVSGTTTLPQTSGKFTAYFDSNNTTSLKVRFSSTGTGVTKFTQLIVGPGIQPQGGVIQGPISYTPSTDGFGTVSGMIAFYSRRGSYLKVQGRFTTGTVNANTAFISLPTGLNVDITSISANIIVGKWWRNQANANLRKTGALSTDYLVNANIVRFNNDDYVTAVAPSVSLAGNALAVSTEVIWFEFELPIAEWSTSGTVNIAQNDVEYVSNSNATTNLNTSDATNFAYGPLGSLIPNASAFTAATTRTVQFSTPKQVGDTFDLELSTDAGVSWVPWPYLRIAQGASSYGAYIGPSTTTNRVVVFFEANGARATNATYAGNGEAWSSLYAANYRWRVRKSSAGSAVGFGIVQGTSAGLVPGSNTNFDDVTATRLGLKQYLHGTTYNGGIAPTVTSAQGGFGVTKAIFIPYQLNDGSWRVKISARCTFTAASVTTIDLTINGISFNVYIQPGFGFFGGITVGCRCYVNTATDIRCDQTAASTNAVSFGGDFELTAKPTWAY